MCCFRFLPVILPMLLLPLTSCQSGGGSGSSALSASSIKKASTTNRGNPFRVQKKSWLRDKTDRIGLTKDKPAARTTTIDEAFRSNQ